MPPARRYKVFEVLPTRDPMTTFPWSFDAARHARHWRRSPPGALRGFPRRARRRLGPLGRRTGAPRGARGARPAQNDLHQRLRLGAAIASAQGEGREVPGPASAPRAPLGERAPSARRQWLDPGADPDVRPTPTRKGAGMTGAGVLPQLQLKS